jgi:hypothetical protein
MTVPAPAPAAVRARNPFAIASLVLVVVLMIQTLVTRSLTFAAPSIAASMHLASSSLGMLFGLLGAVGIVIALAAAVVGLLGVTRPGLPHGLAAAGMAIGITSAVSYMLVYAANSAVGVLVIPR